MNRRYDEKIGTGDNARSLFYQHALMSCDEMGACDRYTIDNGYFTGIELMENAGAAVVDIVLRDFADAPIVHVLCGPGNNGGDGYVVARLLQARGVVVRVYALALSKPNTDAAIAADRWKGAVNSFDAFQPTDEQDLMIDAVFGAGFQGCLPESFVEALHRANSCMMRKLAIDMPSGVSGDTGLVDYGVDFDATVTFFRKKPGHLLGWGRRRCGALTVADIGVRADFLDEHHPAAFENAPAFWDGFIPIRYSDTHKYNQGHTAVFSGPKLQTGAARLSAMAAARMGAGAVTLLGEDAALNIHAMHVSSIMLRECKKGAAADALNSLNKVRSVVLGPGFGDFDEARTIAKLCLERQDVLMPTPLVLDADGITAFADNPEELFALSRARENPALVLTPHEGEFTRLFPDLAADKTLGKLQMAQKAAERAHAVMVYKGAETVIACPAGPQMMDACAAINTNGTPALATAGSGDVLAGMIAGLMAQGMSPFYAASAAVWLHGDAGKRAGPVCIAEDLVAALPDVLRDIPAFNAVD